ncbi:TPA: aldehyde dehydrogenase family protein [Pseudomonas aeruginosa]|nr:aldehyde dehydrogenase family protein [Pseudomonas aeruginosa]
METLFIDGRWVAPSQRESFTSTCPASEEVNQVVGAAGLQDVQLAVQAARCAFDGGWSQSTGRERAGYLDALAEHIEARQESLAMLEVCDNGKPLAEARLDIADTVGCFRYYAGLARELDERQYQPLSVGDDRFSCRLRFEPVGVAGQIIPWNYPLLMAAWKVAPALAAGATCVLKPSELTPLTALELGRGAQAVGLPPGVLNILTGLGDGAGRLLSEHPGVDKLAFTGSVPTGSKVMSAAAADIKNISLELGGKSAFIVFDDADVEEAVEWIMFGIFWNQGQVCSATSRLLVQEGIANRLVERLVEGARAIRVGPGLEDGVQLGPLVSAGQYKKVMQMIDLGSCEARLISGGQRPSHLPSGYFVEPTIFDEPEVTATIWLEEIFGPVLCVKRFKTEVEAIDLANDTRFGLAAAVMSTDLERAARVADALRAGIVWVNCSQPTFTEAPWGGMKQSGIGRELGRWGLDNYLEVKQITQFRGSEPWGWYSKP